MLSQLASDIQAKTEEYGNLQKMVSQAESVQATEKLLDEITTLVGRWAAVFVLIAPLIAEDKAAVIRKEAAAVRHQLVMSHKDFAAQNFQQGIKLTLAKNKAEKLRASTKEVWCAYARGQVEPYRELTSIARRLPKMARQLESIDGYLMNAEKLANDLPAKPDDVKQFHNYLGRLKTLLGDLEGLSSDVRVFLNKLVNGDATFADVNQSVFEWCRAEGLTGKMRITFIK